LFLSIKGRTGHPRARLATIVGAFKAASAKRINELRGSAGIPVWARNYYEHIIRHADALSRIRVYIESNPARWASDILFPPSRQNPRM
jgi:REP-associated tyrosine transposase